jgi:cytidylate kinase
VTAVAIDGPAGAGKSTVARAVAEALGYSYLDTGALYRAVALAAIEAGVDPADEPTLAGLTGALDVSLEREGVRMGGRDVTERIRDADVTSVVSTIAAHPLVRAALLERQRSIARSCDIVMEGRDIGTIVLPEAEVKIYLTASPEERALRRAVQEGTPTDPESLERLRESIAQRDSADASRGTSPLVQAPDAERLDTSGMTFEEVVSRIVETVRAREGMVG